MLNFLNRSNAADARLFELLERKLNLFDGVFGASDEILGALENGVDFEKRVLEIYQSCRRPEDIDAAFDALRADLEKRIDQRMTETRAVLLERFDGDVRKRLKVAGELAKEAVSRRRQSERRFTGAVLGAPAVGRRQLALAAREVRTRQDDAVSYLTLDAATLPERLAHLAGQEGWWHAYRFALSGLVPEETLVHVVMLRHGEGFKVLDLEAAEAFPRIAATDEPTRRPPGVSGSLVHEQAVLAARDALVRAAERRAVLELDAARDRADRFAEDSLFTLRSHLDRARGAWEVARGAVLGLEDLTERAKARATADRLEREYRRRLAQLRSTEEQRYSEKDRTLAALTQKAKVVATRTLVASAYFWVE